MDPQSLEFRAVLETDCTVRRCFRDFLQAQESPISRTVPNSRYSDGFRGACSCSLYRVLIFWEQAQDFKRFERLPSAYRNSRALNVYKVFTAAWSGPSTATLGRVSLDASPTSTSTSDRCVALLRQKSAPCGTTHDLLSPHCHSDRPKPIPTTTHSRSDDDGEGSSSSVRVAETEESVLTAPKRAMARKSPPSSSDGDGDGGEPVSAPIDAWTRVVLHLHEPDGAPADVFAELQEFCFDFLERWAFPMFIEYGIASLSLAKLRQRHGYFVKRHSPLSPQISARSTVSTYEQCKTSIQWMSNISGTSLKEQRPRVSSLEERLHNSLRGYSNGSYSHLLYIRSACADDSPSFRLRTLLDLNEQNNASRKLTSTAASSTGASSSLERGDKLQPDMASIGGGQVPQGVEIEMEIGVFERFLKNRCADSLLLFWQESEKFMSLAPGYYATLALQRIYTKFLRFGAPNQVFPLGCINAQALQDVVASLHHKAHPLILAPLQEHVFDMLALNFFDLWIESPERTAWVESMSPAISAAEPKNCAETQQDSYEAQAEASELDKLDDANESLDKDVGSENLPINNTTKSQVEVSVPISPYTTPVRSRGRSKPSKGKARLAAKSLSSKGKHPQSRYTSPPQGTFLTRKASRMASLSFSCGSTSQVAAGMRNKKAKRGARASVKLTRCKTLDTVSLLRKSASTSFISSSTKFHESFETPSGCWTPRKSDQAKMKVVLGSRPVFYYNPNASTIRPLAIFSPVGAKKLTASKFRKHLEAFARREAEKASKRKNDENREPSNSSHPTSSASNHHNGSTGTEQRSRPRKCRPFPLFVPLQRSNSVDSAIAQHHRHTPKTTVSSPVKSALKKLSHANEGNKDLDSNQDVGDVCVSRADTNLTLRRNPAVLTPLAPRNVYCQPVKGLSCAPLATAFVRQQCSTSSGSAVKTECVNTLKGSKNSTLPLEAHKLLAVSTVVQMHSRVRSQNACVLSAQRRKRARSVPQILRPIPLILKKPKKKRKSKKRASHKSKKGKNGRKKSKSGQNVAGSDSGGGSLSGASDDESTPTSTSTSASSTSSSASSSTTFLPPVQDSSSSLPTTAASIPVLATKELPSIPSIGLPKKVRFSMPRGEGVELSASVPMSDKTCANSISRNVVGTLSIARTSGDGDVVNGISLSQNELDSASESLSATNTSVEPDQNRCTLVAKALDFPVCAPSLIQQPDGGYKTCEVSCASEEDVDEESDCAATDETFEQSSASLLRVNQHTSSSSGSTHAQSESEHCASGYHVGVASHDKSATQGGDLYAEGQRDHEHEDHVPRVPALSLKEVSSAVSNLGVSPDDDESHKSRERPRLSHFVDWQCLLDTGASHSIAPESLSTMLGVSPHTARKAIVGSGESIVLNVLSLMAFLRAGHGRVLGSKVDVSIRPDQCGAGSRIGVDVLHQLKAVIAPRPSYGPQPIDTIDVFCLRKRFPAAADRNMDGDVGEDDKQVGGVGVGVARKISSKVDRERGSFQRPFIPVKFLQHSKRSGGGRTTCVDADTINVLIDTGAVRSAVSRKVREALALPTVGRLDVRVANGNVDERETVQVRMLVAKRRFDMEVSVRHRPCLLGMDFVTQANVRIFFS